MKRSKIIAVAVLSLLAASFCTQIFAQSAPAGEVDIQALIRNAPGEISLPLDDVVLLYDHLVVTLHDDGRVERRRRQVIKILNEYGVDNHCDPRIGWNAATQELVVHGLKTIMLDGRVVEQTTGMDRSHNLSRVTSDGLDDFPDFIHHQETVVTFLAIERGSVVDFDYSIVDRVSPSEGSGRQWKGVSDVHVMQDGNTALTRKFTIRAPLGAHMRLCALNGAPVKEENTREGMQIVSWTATDVPGIRVVTDCRGAADFLPAVAYDVWVGPADDRYGWHRDWKVSFDAAVDRAGALPEKAVSLCEGLISVDDKFKAIHAFSRKAVQTVDFEPLLLDEPARPVERVYESTYASGKEHVALLLALCRSADIDCWPILTSDCDVHGDLCVQGAITGVVLAVNLEQGQFFADPASPLDEDLAMMTPDCLVLTPVKKGRPPSASPCRVRVTGEITVGSDLVPSASVTVRQTGPGNPFMKLSDFGDGDRDRYLGGVAGRILPEGKVEKHNILDLTRLQASYALSVKAPALKEEPNGTIRLPMLPPEALVGSVLPAIFSRPPSTRESPVRVDFPVNYSCRLTVKVPDNLKVVRVPETVELVDRLGSCAFRWTAGEGKVTLDCSLDLGKSVVGPETYGALRSLMLQAVDKQAAILLFSRIDGKS
jgi:hypothetical protein